LGRASAADRDTLIGGSGNDYFDGGELKGPDVVNYSGAGFRVVGDLAKGTINSGGDTDRRQKLSRCIAD